MPSHFKAAAWISKHFSRTSAGELSPVSIFSYSACVWRCYRGSRDFHPGSQHIARAADITPDADIQFDYGNDGYGFGLGRSDSIGSHGFDLNSSPGFCNGPVAVRPPPASTMTT